MTFRQLKMFCVVACGLAVCIAGPALGQTVNLNNGVAGQGDGYLEVNVDAFGSWSSSGFGGGGDLFNPIGGGPPLAAKAAVFTNGFFLFHEGTERVLLSQSTNWQNTYGGAAGAGGGDGSLVADIIQPAMLMGDTATGSFRVYNPNDTSDLDVTINVTSSLSAPALEAHAVALTTAYGGGNDGPNGESTTLYQTYTAVNNNPGQVSFDLVRAVDADLLFAPGAAFNDDEVGTDTNAKGSSDTVSVWQQDSVNPGVSRLTTTLRGIEANGGTVGNYYGGLQGETPPDPPGGPAFGYGTDVQVWDAYGVPDNWRNYVAQVGYNTDGQSGPGVTQDAFHGVSATVRIIPEPTSFILCALFGMGLLGFRRR